MPEVDRIVGNQEKLAADSYRGDGVRVRVNDIMSVRETAGHLVTDFQGRTRAFVQVQQGCDHRCTYCIIPYGRGPSRSVPISEVVRQVRRLVAGGYREVVLTGVDLSAYGGDLPGRPTLAQLVRRLLARVPALPRLRLSSLDPAEVDEDLLCLIAGESRLMPHLHLSLQAGDDMILKRMKRRHTRAQAVALCERLRRLRPEMAFGADLIAGFPTETEAMFGNTLALVDDCGLHFLHVFPFSARPGTPAARMPRLPGALRKQRSERLRTAGATALARFLDGRVGTTARGLVEKPPAGHSEQYAAVRIVDAPPAATPAGAIVDVRVTGVDDRALVGRLVA
jgi:threonylcarbamoyladenosine tRNA methylthiotransferase MtaB